MTLEFKPDFAEARTMWEKFWNDANERPLILGVDSALPPEAPSPYRECYWRASSESGQAEILADIDASFPHQRFAGENIPFFSADLGPDQFAAILGSPLRFTEEIHTTNWINPRIEDLHDFHISMDQVRSDPTFLKWLKWIRRLAQHASGRYLAGSYDLHSGLDALSALRGPQNLCLDFYDCPEEVTRVMEEIRKLYIPVFKELAKASGWTADTGGIGWIPAWSAGRFAVTQCDFGYMISPEDFRKFAIPAIEEESAYLTQTVYHLDGIGNLRHLDDILSLEHVKAVQWVPGDGQKPMYEWLDVLRRIIAAKKKLQIVCPTTEAARQLHLDLGKYRGVFYCIGERLTQEKFDVLQRFFLKN